MMSVGAVNRGPEESGPERIGRRWVIGVIERLIFRLVDRILGWRGRVPEGLC